jgi:hypothetical protein
VKVISCYDLMLADPLKGMNIFDLCHLDNADKVYAVLETIGMDVSKAVHIYPAQHRTLSGDVKIGYLFAGELSLKRQHLKGPYSMPDDVLIAASLQDSSLFEELHAMGHTSPMYGGEHALDDNIPTKEAEEYKAEELKIVEQIKQLEDILYHIRGEQRNDDGSFKTLEDFRNPKPAEKKRKKHKSRKNVEGNIDE